MEIRATDMDEKSDMRREAIEKVNKNITIKATEFLSSTDIHEEEVSKRMKEYFDMHYSPNWHCIIGKLYLFKFLNK